MKDFETELNLAILSRKKGNEGKARVCARRAVGIIIGVYLRRNSLANPGPSAYARIKSFASLEQVPETIRMVTEHFLLQVDEEFQLPAGVDLIADAQWLANRLLNDLEEK